MTCFLAHKHQTINARTLKAWRSYYLDVDGVFDPAFLREIIFTGVRVDDIDLASDTEILFEQWQTLKVTYQPHVKVSDGPYCIDKGLLNTVWRVYEDTQLAFLQATWPSTDDDR